MFANSKKSFTLIELLVVIAIIGLLASIIFVSLAGTRKKAEFTAVKQFSSSIKHVLGAYEIGEWNFDNTPNGDCTGSPNAIKDASGNGNNGTCYNGVNIIDSDSVARKSASFNGTSHTYISINDSVSLNSPTDNITVEVWVKPPLGATFINNHSFAGFIKGKLLGEDVFAIPHFSLFAIPHFSLVGGLLLKDSSMYFSIFKNFESNKFLFFSLAGVSSGHSQQPINLNLGEWNHLVGTYNGSKMVLYLNAKQLGSAVDCSGNIDWQPGNLYIGTRNPSGSDSDFFTGYIDEVRIYDSPLISAQVKELYSEGLKERKIVGK